MKKQITALMIEPNKHPCIVTKCGVYHQPLWGCISSRASVYSLRLDEIQHFVLMIYRNKLRMIYTPSA